MVASLSVHWIVAKPPPNQPIVKYYMHTCLCRWWYTRARRDGCCDKTNHFNDMFVSSRNGKNMFVQCCWAPPVIIRAPQTMWILIEKIRFSNKLEEIAGTQCVRKDGRKLHVVLHAARRLICTKAYRQEEWTTCDGHIGKSVNYWIVAIFCIVCGHSRTLYFRTPTNNLCVLCNFLAAFQ